VASRFVAGERLADAVRVVQELNARGFNVTLDHLGEYTGSEAEAGRAVEAVLAALDAIHAGGLRSGVSIKLTQIGLSIGADLCEANLRRILERARQHDIFLRIDMEDSRHLPATLALFEKMLAEFGAGQVGIVLQSYLYRSREDAAGLVRRGVRVRLVKGAYKEPAEVAFPKKPDVDAEFDRMTEVLVEGACAAGAPPLSDHGRRPPIPAIASHDSRRVTYARQAAQRAGLPRHAIEFQMLYGIRRELQEELLAAGYPVRIYVPYGSEWYPYFVRRLAERPANLWFFVSNLFRK
jgi:proline dehydrogenase